MSAGSIPHQHSEAVCCASTNELSAPCWLWVSFSGRRMCLCVILEGPQTFRNASLSCRPHLSSPCSPPYIPPRPPPSYKAAQQPIRGAPLLIRVTNWRLAGAETPPHLHGHVTFKEVRRVRGRVLGGERRGRVWISLTEQTKRGVKGGKRQATRRQTG